MIATPSRAALALGLLAALPASGASAQAGDRLVACETLIALRLLTASAPGDRAAAAARIAEQPACRLVPRDAVGEVEHRAMIGGSPFECLAVRTGGSCLWVQP